MGQFATLNRSVRDPHESPNTEERGKDDRDDPMNVLILPCPAKAKHCDGDTERSDHSRLKSHLRVGQLAILFKVGSVNLVDVVAIDEAG